MPVYFLKESTIEVTKDKTHTYILLLNTLEINSRYIRREFSLIWPAEIIDKLKILIQEFDLSYTIWLQKMPFLIRNKYARSFMAWYIIYVHATCWNALEFVVMVTRNCLISELLLVVTKLLHAHTYVCIYICVCACAGACARARARARVCVCVCV
jgi:hypothetical protein